MKIRILDEAQEDLMEGFRFYENLDEGLGSYFLDCLFSDIDSLLQFFGIHPIVFDYHQSRHAGFPLLSTTKLRVI